jgi:pimeloyl-ACP methyl ester carboxylesterase
MKPTAHPARSRRSRRLGGLALAGGLIAAPIVAHMLIRRRLRAPEAPRWGRTHRFAGHVGPLVFRELGSGPAVVMLHGFGPGFDCEQWRGAAEVLAPRFHVFAPDLPGWGRSAPGEPRPSLYLAALAEFLQGVVRERVVLVAAGLAAAYAVRLAAEHPGRVRALALVAPLGLPLAGQGSSRTVARALEPLLRVPLLRDPMLDAMTSRAALGRYLRRRAFAAPERVDAALIEHHYRLSHLAAHRRALAAYWRGDLQPEADLAGLTVPAWIAWGGTAPSAQRLADQLALLPAGSHIEYFAGSRGLPHAEQPLAFSQALGSFLLGLPA